MTINFEEVFNGLKKSIGDLAQKTFKDYVSQARADGQKILDLLRDQLKDYTRQFAENEISAMEFKDLILGQKDELEVVALKQAGIAAIEADKFKAGVLDLIVKTITGLI